MSNFTILRFKKNIVFLIFTFFISFCILTYLMGCEAFVKKFTRKNKKEKMTQESVIEPQEYLGSDMTIQERYRDYIFIWKSWHEELISALSTSGKHKKRKSCIQEAIKNLEAINSFLFEEKQKELFTYLEELRELEKAITKDLYDRKIIVHREKASDLKRDILRDFSYAKVKNHLK